jgi:hypothetical protein
VSTVCGRCPRRTPGRPDSRPHRGSAWPPRTPPAAPSVHCRSRQARADSRQSLTACPRPAQGCGSVRGGQRPSGQRPSGQHKHPTAVPHARWTLPQCPVPRDTPWRPVFGGWWRPKAANHRRLVDIERVRPHRTVGTAVVSASPLRRCRRWTASRRCPLPPPACPAGTGSQGAVAAGGRRRGRGHGRVRSGIQRARRPNGACLAAWWPPGPRAWSGCSSPYHPCSYDPSVRPHLPYAMAARGGLRSVGNRRLGLRLSELPWVWTLLANSGCW